MELADKTACSYGCTDELLYCGAKWTDSLSIFKASCRTRKGLQVSS